MSNQAPSHSAEGGLFFQFRPETEKDNKNPRNPCNPCQKNSSAEKTIEDVLLHFGETKKVARRRYREFVEKGIAQGRRTDLQGGGLVRSAGRNKAGLLGRKKDEREKGDARILGSGDFVNEALRKAGEDRENSTRKKMPIEQLILKVSKHLDLKESSIVSARPRKVVREARGIICCLSINDYGYSAKEVAKN